MSGDRSEAETSGEGLSSIMKPCSGGKCGRLWAAGRLPEDPNLWEIQGLYADMRKRGLSGPNSPVAARMRFSASAPTAGRKVEIDSAEILP